MKTSFLFLLLSSAAFAAPKTEFKSVYTDLKKDCVEVQASNDSSEIDFFESECKSFGGYVLKVSGGDLRYSPKLSFAGQEIDLQEPMGFHDTASDKVEWIYQSTRDTDGSGSIQWMGFIYRLTVSDETSTNTQHLYSVRLDGAKSCLIGKSKTNSEARKLVYTSKAGCK